MTQTIVSQLSMKHKCIMYLDHSLEEENQEGIQYRGEPLIPLEKDVSYNLLRTYPLLGIVLSIFYL